MIRVAERKKSGDRVGGQAAKRDAWKPDMEILPESLPGHTTNELTSIFRVIRPLSEVECYGYFDVPNAYDLGFISIGHCHWTISLVNKEGNTDKGELTGLLTYYKYENPSDYKKWFGDWGHPV